MGLCGFIFNLLVLVQFQIFILELNCDIAYSICIVVFYAMFSVQFVFLNQDFDVLSFFYLQLSLNVLTTMYTYWYIVETKGLTEEQKRQLYIPGGVAGRKLRSGEAFGLKHNPKVVVAYVDCE